MYRRSSRYFLFIVIGFTTLASQIMILRQLMVVFGGNELTLGLALASWMIWAGLANLVVGKFSDRLQNIGRIVTLVATLLAIIFPATLVVTSLIKPILGISMAETTNLITILFVTITVLGPLCFIDGAFLNLLAKTGGRESSVDIGEVYLCDALGAALGGVAFGWIAVEYLNPFLAMCILGLLLLFAVLFITPKRIIFVPLIVAGCLIFVTIISSDIADIIKRATWAGYNPVINIDTKYQNLVVTENRGEYTMFSDALPLFTIPDKPVNETLAHLPSLEVKQPERILVIGGGISEIAAELNKHVPEEITYIQIDPEVTELETTIMGGRIPENVNVLHEDGRYYLNTFENKKYDIIILNSGDPVNASTNRYFTKEFFETAKNALTEDGVIFFGIYKTANYISKDVLRLLSIIYNTLNAVFPDVVIVPLDRYYFLSSNESGIMTNQKEELQARLKGRKIATDIFSVETLLGTNQWRIDRTTAIIKEESAKSARINTDDRPTAYFNSMMIWGEKFGAGTKEFFNFLADLKYRWIIAALALIGVLSLILAGRFPTLPVFLALFAAGWAGINLELLILIKYQVEVGMLFYEVGFIITAYMVGLSLGAFAIIHSLKRFKPSNCSLLILMIIMAAYIPAALYVTRISFILANFLIAFLGGAIYQTAAEVMICRGVGRTAGLINGADYMGAAAGSLVASSLLIPLFGFNITVVISIVIIGIAAINILFIFKKS